jgi:hypothetical protein
MRGKVEEGENVLIVGNIQFLVINATVVALNI